MVLKSASGDQGSLLGMDWVIFPVANYYRSWLVVNIPELLPLLFNQRLAFNLFTIFFVFFVAFFNCWEKFLHSNFILLWLVCLFLFLNQNVQFLTSFTTWVSLWDTFSFIGLGQLDWIGIFDVPHLLLKALCKLFGLIIFLMVIL